MQFRKVTSRKYIGENGFSLIQSSANTFSIYKGAKLASWGQYFPSVKAAEYFMNTHDYIHASADMMPLSHSDICDIINMYCGEVTQTKSDIIHDKFTLTDNYSLAENPNRPELDLYKNDKLVKTFSDADSCVRTLDQIVDCDLFSSVSLRGTELRSILAAKLRPNNDRRNAKDATQNLVRVKSSNVWSYGVEMKDRHVKEGDVYVQFKGKNGGPGDVYVYYDVPLITWRKFLSAPSKGHFVWQYLRNNFLYSKLTGSKKGVLPNAVNNR